jgi:hypothetical protein
VIPDVGADLIVHHDLAPWNLIASATGVRGFIDWDVAAPGTRLWDLAYAAHGFVPLTPDPATARPDPAQRLRVLVDAYGLDECDRMQLAELLPRRTPSDVRPARRGLCNRDAALGDAVATRSRQGLARDTAYTADHIDLWRAALLS